MLKKILIAAAISAYTLILGKNVVKIVKVKRGIAEIERRCEELRRENEELKRELSRLKGDRDYLEYLVKRELGWVRKDEVIIVVGEPQQGP